MNYSKQTFNTIWPYIQGHIVLKDKGLHEKSFEIASIPKFDGCERGRILKFYNFLIKNVE